VDVAAIVVAAGEGERYGSRKQFCDLAGRSVASRSVDAARSVAEFVVIVVPPDVTAESHGADAVVAGGPSRAASVRAGLAAIAGTARVVVVHDAARPLASPALFHAVVRALDDTSLAGAVPGLAIADTVKRVNSHDDPIVVETLDRATLVAVQTPQAFVADTLRRAHDEKREATDDASLVEAIGGRVAIVPGEQSNRKLTTRDDLESMLAALEAR
jgi:2-C-methyl-D-erythritol 4-phosphate cytidylyltransferase